MALGDGLDRGRIVRTDANAEKMSDTARTCRVQSRIERTAMSGEIEPVQMTVGIYQHGKSLIAWLGKAAIVR